MQVGNLVEHRVGHMIGIVLRTPKVGGRWRLVRWNNGMEFSEKIINLVLLCK